MTSTSPGHPFAATYLIIGSAAVAVPVVALVGELPSAHYPMAVVSSVVFFAATATQTALNNFRPLVSPQTVAISVWCLLLVVFPSALNYFPAVLGQLPYLPSDKSINLAILLNAVAFIAFMVGNQIRLSRPSDDERPAQAPLDLTPLIRLFAVAGLVGIALRFGNVNALSSYIRGVGPTYLFEQLTGFRAVLATILPPFLSFSFVMLIERWRLTKKLTVPKVIIAGSGVIFPLVLYSYNRAAVVIPLVGLVGALSQLGRRRRTGMLAVFAVAVALGSYQAGRIRGEITATEGGRFTPDQVGIAPGNGPSPWETLSVYGQSPQSTAFALGVPLRQDFPGQSLISSLLSPVPGLGGYFRDSTGTASYNLAIYGTPKITDQIMPLTAESWDSLGLLGTVPIFFVIGFCIGHTHRRFLAEATIIRSYMVIVVGLWISMASIISLLVLAQVFVYFLWPHATFALICRVRRRRMTGAAPVAGRRSDYSVKPWTAPKGSLDAH